jgi:hypothetical protein
MITHSGFPHLTDQNHRVTSPASVDYNCVAWSAGDTHHWWQPGIYWPTKVSPWDCGIGDLIAAFKTMGYEDCDDDTWVAGVEKIALYGSGFLYSHAARQLPN